MTVKSQVITKTQTDLLLKVQSVGAKIDDDGIVTLNLVQLEKLKEAILKKNNNKIFFPPELSSILKHIEANGDCC